MTNLTAIANAGVFGSYQFGAFNTAIDVGGGHGSFLAMILDGNPTAKKASCSTSLRSSKTPPTPSSSVG
jgi:hypothetical protein